MKALFLVLLLSLGVLFYVAQQTLPTLTAPVEAPEAPLPAPIAFPTLPVAEDISPAVSTSSPSTSGPQILERAPLAKIEVAYAADFALALEAAIHEAVNVERVKNGLKALKYDAALADVARGHSADMANANYFAHTDDDDCDSACRLNEAGYKWQAVGENLFLIDSGYRHTVSDAAAVFVQGWMGSDGHRKNILEKTFTYEGLGVVVLDDKIYATELLARPQ